MGLERSMRIGVSRYCFSKTLVSKLWELVRPTLVVEGVSSLLEFGPNDDLFLDMIVLPPFSRTASSI